MEERSTETKKSTGKGRKEEKQNRKKVKSRKPDNNNE